MSTEAIYDRHRDSWIRRVPVSLSDFTGRPAVFDLIGDVKGFNIADFGCGEGYCARYLINAGAAHIDGVDISSKMVEAAAAAVQGDERASFIHGTVTETPFENNFYDLVVGIFVYNYLHVEQTLKSFKEAYRVLKPGGRFVFSVPHPSFPFIRKDQVAPFYFNTGEKGYFSARNQRFQGHIWRRDGKMLPVEFTHKTLQDYFSCLSDAGFQQLPRVEELGVKDEHLELDKAFFEPVHDLPLHLAFATTKPRIK